VAAVSLNEAGHPIHARITGVSGFSSGAIADWAKRHLSPGSKHPNELPQFRWINTLLGNVKTSFTSTFHAFNFDKYARRNPVATASVSTGASPWPP